MNHEQIFMKTELACIGFFCFSFNKRCPKDAARKTEFFAYVIS